MTATEVAPPMPRARSATPDLPPDHRSGATQRRVVGGDLAGAHEASGLQSRTGSGNTLAPAQYEGDTQPGPGGGDNLPPTNAAPDPKVATSAASISDPGQAGTGIQATPAGAALLALAAASLDDIERTRIAMGNRLRAMRDDHGLAAAPEYERAELIHQALEVAEHNATLELKRSLRKHPLGAWVKATVGIGEKQGARLLAAIDDPYWNHAEDRPRRGPAELWAYCGYAPGQKRQKGVKSNWNAAAKMRARLCAESCIKQMHSPYRAVYDTARARWEDRDTSDLHKHQHALRCVAKAILRDLYLAGRDAA